MRAKGPVVHLRHARELALRTHAGRGVDDDRRLDLPGAPASSLVTAASPGDVGRASIDDLTARARPCPRAARCDPGPDHRCIAHDIRLNPVPITRGRRTRAVAGGLPWHAWLANSGCQADLAASRPKSRPEGPVDAPTGITTGTCPRRSCASSASTVARPDDAGRFASHPNAVMHPQASRPGRPRALLLDGPRPLLTLDADLPWQGDWTLALVPPLHERQPFSGAGERR